MKKNLQIISKVAILLLTIYFLLPTASALAPPKMSYQAVIRDGSKNLVTSHAVGMQISILQGASNGTPLYVETQNATTNANDLVTIEIGTGTTADNFATIDWSVGPYFIKTETDPDAVLLTDNQAIAGNKTFTGTTTVSTPVNATDATTKAYVDALKEIIYNELGVVNDVDGNTYNTVTIGTQVWMVENLKTIKYNDGTDIPLVTDNNAWEALSTSGYCWYNNDETANKNVYGALYNWYAVDATRNGGKNVCPIGWHVPSDAEWTTLTTYLGGESGGKLKETGTTHWTTPNTSATNKTGFTALPGGYRCYCGTFYSIGHYGYWWSATEYDATNAWFRYMGYGYSDVIRDNSVKLKGGEASAFSVRCLRD